MGRTKGGVPGGGRGGRGGAGDGGGERSVSPESGLQAQSIRSAVARPACTGPLQNATDTMPHEEQEQLASHPVRKSRRRVTSEDALGLGLENWLRKTDACGPAAKQDVEPKTVPAQFTQAQPTALPQTSSTRKAPLSASHSRKRRKPDILAGTTELSEYELQRLKNTKSNEAFLKSLGLCNIPLQAKRRGGRRRGTTESEDDSAVIEVSERGEKDGSMRRLGGKQIVISSVEQEEPGMRAGGGRGGVGGGKRGAVVGTGGV